MSRRGSTSFVPKALPFAIHHDIMDAGKIIHSSKKIVTWRFGYPDEDHVQTVVLKHSVTGGKKEILENGKRVVLVGHQAVVTDFAHGWESLGRILRVAVSTNGEYSFSVDGVVYEEFPSEYESKKRQDDIIAKTKREEHSTKLRRKSSDKKHDPPQRRHSASFDPFATDSTTQQASTSSFFDQKDDGFGSTFNSSDPFASTTQKSVVKHADPFSSDFNTNQDGHPRMIARQFTSPPEQYETPSIGSFNADDFFANSSSSSQSTHKKPQQNSTNDFFGGPSSPKQTRPHQQQATVDDFFADNTHSGPQHQTSTQSTPSVFDFTGMTYDMPTPPPMTRNQSIPEASPPQQEHHKMQQAQHQSSSNGFYGLVDLNLSSGMQSKAQPQRNKSIYDTSSNQNSQRSNASINPFDDFHAAPHPQQSYQAQLGHNAGGTMNQGNWMASSNIGMMTGQSGFMNQPQNPQANQGKTSLDSLDWRKM